jgi:subtilisin-like proprotein convertase family protein
MAAIVYDFSIEQGSYTTVTFVYQNANSQPIDISDWCAVLQWTDNLGQSKVFTNRAKSSQYDLKTFSDGRIVLNIPASETNSYVFDTAIYDLDIQEPNEQYSGSGYKTFRLASGTVFLVKRTNPQLLLSNCIDIPSDNNQPCPIECLINDIYSVLYNGEGISISDNSTSSSSITINDNRQIEKVEIIINGLNHKHPQDLQFILTTPVSDSILLSANHKIKNYIPGFNWVFSDDAQPGNYLHTIKSNEKCRIYDKVDIINYNNESLIASLSSLQGFSAQGLWSLVIRDTDPGTEAGSLLSWGIIITYIE